MPFVLESNYHITPDEYERRKALPWPDSVPGSFVPTVPATNGARATTSKLTGPVMTTEVIGASSPKTTAQVQQLFESYLQEKATEQKPHSERQGEKSQ